MWERAVWSAASQLSGSIARIRSTIDRSAYHVFLTPDGDASLYVAQKTPSGFIVRETRGVSATLDFEYRIIGRSIDAKNDRLQCAPPVRRPQRAHPSR